MHMNQKKLFVLYFRGAKHKCINLVSAFKEPDPQRMELSLYEKLKTL